jgi:hypothetical protein
MQKNKEIPNSRRKMVGAQALECLLGKRLNYLGIFDDFLKDRFIAGSDPIVVVG